MPLALKAMAFRPTRGERHDGIQPIERLSCRLLVGREHGRMLRRVQRQADHIGRFLLERIADVA